MDASESRNCQPYPLGWVTANLRQVWLWPRQSVSMGEEATAARGFHNGDSARFVLYSGFNETEKKRRGLFPLHHLKSTRKRSRTARRFVSGTEDS
jgi:hypothetical protein